MIDMPVGSVSHTTVVHDISQVDAYSQFLTRLSAEYYHLLPHLEIIHHWLKPWSCHLSLFLFLFSVPVWIEETSLIWPSLPFRYKRASTSHSWNKLFSRLKAFPCGICKSSHPYTTLPTARASDRVGLAERTYQEMGLRWQQVTFREVLWAHALVPEGAVL